MRSGRLPRSPSVRFPRRPSFIACRKQQGGSLSCCTASSLDLSLVLGSSPCPPTRGTVPSTEDLGPNLTRRSHSFVDPSIALCCVSMAHVEGLETKAKVQWRDEMVEVQVNDQTRVGELLDSVVERTGCDPSTVKLVQGNVVLTQVEREKRIDDCGVKAKKKFMVVASAAGDVVRVREAKTERLRSFEEEADIVRRRAQVGPSQTNAATTCDRKFGEFRALDVPEGCPPKEQALELLKNLAMDPGVVGVMQKHGWKVALLSEMPPEGKVGLSEKCLLGYNRNRGQEIALRLRTDDWRGFRKYLTVRQTLLHELAHMEYDEHDNLFKALNSKINKECNSFDWRNVPGKKLAGDAFMGPGQQEVADASQGMPRKVGGTLEENISPQHAAGLAAMRRHQQQKE